MLADFLLSQVSPIQLHTSHADEHPLLLVGSNYSQTFQHQPLFYCVVFKKTQEATKMRKVEFKYCQCLARLCLGELANYLFPRYFLRIV